MRGFDGRPAPSITDAIYPTLTVQIHAESLAPLLVIKLGQHPIILGKPWIRKLGVILDMSCDKLMFWPDHCQHPGAPKLLPMKVNKLTPAEPERVQHILNPTVEDADEDEDRLNLANAAATAKKPHATKDQLKAGLATV